MGRHEDSERARRAARAVCGSLQDSGHIAYLAGGCVRDELLGLEPTDYDVATDATPDRIRDLFVKTSEVGAAFGVMLVRDHGVSIEVATFREEGAYTDRRRPDDVRFSTPQRDAARRDYTVNALFLDPVAAGERDAGPEGVGAVHGHVIDFVGGMDDLHRKLIRAVGDPEARLAEDHLRALRAVRFAARLGFEIEPATAAAIRAHASELTGVSRERIGDEVRRILSHASRARGARLLCELGLDAPVFGEAWPSSSLERLATLAGDDVPLPTSLAAWALDRGLALGDRAIGALVMHWRAALMLSNDERDALHGTLSMVLLLRDRWASMGVAPRKRAAGSVLFGEAMRVLRALDAGAADAVARDERTLRDTRSGIAPDALVTGDDLVALGFTPGPGFKALLDAVYDAQLEDRVGTRDEAIAIAQREAASHGVTRRGG